jgi:hypothetical protein
MMEWRYDILHNNTLYDGNFSINKTQCKVLPIVNVIFIVRRVFMLSGIMQNVIMQRVVTPLKYLVDPRSFFVQKLLGECDILK